MEYQNELNRCISIVKWDPNKALHDMYVLKDETIESIIKQKQWIRAAKEINRYLDSLVNTRFYNESKFWNNNEPTRLEI